MSEEKGTGVKMLGMPDVREKLMHELGECLWGIAVLAGQYDIDLEEAFQKQLENVRTIRNG